MLLRSKRKRTRACAVILNIDQWNVADIYFKEEMNLNHHTRTHSIITRLINQNETPECAIFRIRIERKRNHGFERDLTDLVEFEFFGRKFVQCVDI
jgi:hypothetical protein